MAFIRIQFRRGTSTEWETNNPVLAEGEMGLELDTFKFKIGNSSDTWNDLDYGGLTGPGLVILGELSSASQLPVSAKTGEAYNIGGDLYVWDGGSWNDVGRFQGPKAQALTQEISLSGTSVTVNFADYSIQSVLNYEVLNSNNDVVELATNVDSEKIILDSNISLNNHRLKIVYLS